MNVILVDFPIHNYLSKIEIEEVFVRKPLHLYLRFLRKLPGFSLYISNTKERSMWELDCIGYKTVVLFDTYAHYSEYAHKIERIVSEDTRLILYLLNPAFSLTIILNYPIVGRYGHLQRWTLRNMDFGMGEHSIILIY